MKRVFSLAFIPPNSALKSEVTRELDYACRRPSRAPIGLGRSAPRLGWSEPYIVKVEQEFHFAFLDK
jgi:hypothetical protein